MNDTPRTDRVELRTTEHILPKFVVDADVCRELERENAELKRVIDDPHAMQIHYRRTGNGWDVCSTERVQALHRDNERLERENAALREVLDLTVDRLMFYMECIPMAHKDYIKTLEGKMSYEIVNKSLILLKKEAQP